MRGGITPKKLGAKSNKKAAPLPGGIDPQGIGVRSAFEETLENRGSDPSALDSFIGGDLEQIGTALEHGVTAPDLDLNNPDQMAPTLQQRYGPHTPVMPFAWSIETIAPSQDLDIFNGKALPEGRFYLDDLHVSIIQESGNGENAFVFYVGDKTRPDEQMAQIQGNLWANLGAHSIRTIFWAGIARLSGGGGFGDPGPITTSEALLVRDGLVKILAPEKTIRVLNASSGRTFRMAGVAFLTTG